MKIGLIAMSGVRVRTKELAELGVTLPQFVNRGAVVASLPSLGLLTVAALTPRDVEVAYREIDELPGEDELEMFDLVGISSFTAMIDDAYALAGRYRAAGVPVVLGGLHVTLMPDEAAEHADAIVTGGAEGAWPQLVADFRAGRMKPRYEGMRQDVFREPWYAKPRFDLLAGRPYNRVTVQTSRGCPLNCEFCAASLRITNSFQQKPVELAIAEIGEAIAQVDRPFLELADDNTFVNKRWGKQFLRALGKRRHADHYLEAIERIQSHGITVNGCFILGLDGDTPETFERVRDFVAQSGLLEVQLTVQTPFPGTPLYDRLRREGLLLSERYWDRCTLFDVNYQPKNMSVEELETGMRWLFGEIYTEREFIRRKRHYMDILHANGTAERLAAAC
jgi:radical SAM superfamily enzyme YgiQ (UPF0313 family)